VQLVPADKLDEEQVPETEREKSAVLLIVGSPQPVAAALPEFERVKVWGAEVLPTVTLPKSWVRGDQARTGAMPLALIWFRAVVGVPPTAQELERVVAVGP
jgi:hypothetical protein